MRQLGVLLSHLQQLQLEDLYDVAVVVDRFGHPDIAKFELSLLRTKL